MFINFSNHPSGSWSEAQLSAAQAYGHILDIPFPTVQPDASEEEIRKLADKIQSDITSKKPTVVLCQGEMTLMFEVVKRLIQKNISVVAACSKRCATEAYINGEMVKISSFKFVQFRKFN